MLRSSNPVATHQMDSSMTNDRFLAKSSGTCRGTGQLEKRVCLRKLSFKNCQLSNFPKPGLPTSRDWPFEVTTSKHWDWIKWVNSNVRHLGASLQLISTFQLSSFVSDDNDDIPRKCPLTPIHHLRSEWLSRWVPAPSAGTLGHGRRRTGAAGNWCRCCPNLAASHPSTNKAVPKPGFAIGMQSHSPHLCGRFLFFVLYPVRLRRRILFRRRVLCRTQLCHVTHLLSHTTLSHTIFHTHTHTVLVLVSSSLMSVWWNCICSVLGWTLMSNLLYQIWPSCIILFIVLKNLFATFAWVCVTMCCMPSSSKNFLTTDWNAPSLSE